MRILFCNYEYPPLGGGGGVINALIAQEMAKHHEVTVLTSQGLGLPRENIESGVRVVRAPVFFRKQESVATLRSMLAYIPMGIRAGHELIKANHYDVINTYFVLPTGPVGNALSNSGGIPNVLTLLGGDIYDPSKFLSPHRHPVLRAAVRHLLRKADIVVGDSNDTIEKMQRYHSPETKGVWIPLGIQRPKVEPASRKRYGFEEDEVLLVTVGRLVPRKGIDQLISMMESFKGQRVHLLVIGAGPEENSLRQEALKRQLDSQVHFMGYVEENEKFRILKMSDLYVSTSQHEGFGLVFLEGMACGLPVVCYDHGGHTDFLRDQETGYIVRLNDLELFKARCQLLIENSDLRKAIGEKNKRHVEEFYIDKCALRYESIFREAVAIHANKHSVGQRVWSMQKRAA
ncbi:MAG: glycosyltransferase family 4 protein [Deltaproteobacteria bacterium]|nr:MAG: glycosyltransferase family 4 protein [Deltaproteobacteria bacterium]